MNFLELQNLVAYWLDDLQFGYFTPTQVKLWLNNAQKEVQKRLLQRAQNFYNVRCQTTLIVNQSDYVLPQDFKVLHNLEVILSGAVPNETCNPIIPITVNQKYLVTTGVGTPEFYYFKRNRLVLQPAPDTALVMRLTYSYAVADMVLDTDIPDCPPDYAELIALLAAEDGFVKDGRTSALLEKKIAEYKTSMDQDSQERNQDTTRTVVETGNDSDMGFFW